MLTTAGNIEMSSRDLKNSVSRYLEVQTGIAEAAARRCTRTALQTRSEIIGELPSQFRDRVAGGCLDQRLM